MPNLVYMATEDQTPYWLAGRWRRFTDFEFFNPERYYRPDTVFMYDLYRSDLSTIAERVAQGYRVLIDYANEHYVHINHADLLSLSQRAGQQVCWIISGVQATPARFRIVTTPFWYWILDQQNLRDAGLDQVRYAPTGQHDWLCTMSLGRTERDVLYESLKTCGRPGFLSYRSLGHFLPDDDDSVVWQRRVNHQWLANSYYTIVPESYVQDNDYRNAISITERNAEFICEKTLKPIAGQHPFIVAGTRGTLQHVRDLGFETFPELFDESYDLLFRWQHRLDAVIKQVQQFDARAVQQPRVLDKLRHNQDRFFDRSLTEHFFETSVAQPVMAWILETT